MDDRCRCWGVQEDALQEFKEWYNSKPHLPQNIPDDYLAQFLHSCYFNLEQAKKAIEVYFKAKTNAPEFFANRSLDFEPLLKYTKVCELVVLPETTERGYNVLLGRLVDPNPSLLYYEDAIKYVYMLVDLVLRERPGCPGIVFVYDLAGYSFRHLFRVNLSSAKKYFEYTQEGCPMRHKAMHFINANSVITNLLTLCKPFMYKEHSKKMQFHKNANLETLSKILSISNIPKDYGGEAPTMAKLQEETMKRLRAYDAWFKFDETLRLTDGTTKANNVNKVEKNLNNLSIN